MEKGPLNKHSQSGRCIRDVIWHNDSKYDSKTKTTITEMHFSASNSIMVCMVLEKSFTMFSLSHLTLQIWIHVIFFIPETGISAQTACDTRNTFYKTRIFVKPPHYLELNF